MVEEGKPEYLVFGMGAIGSVLAGLLSEAGCSVTCQGRGRHFRQAMDQGLKITGIWGEHYLPPGRMDELGAGEKFPVILLCVKSMHTLEAASQAAGLLEDDGIMVSMQNGLGNWETIASVVGRARTAGGRVIFGSEIPQPGVARVTVNADDVLMGPAFGEGAVNERLLSVLERDLRLGGIPARVVSAEEIKAALWGKVLYNSALNPLSAVLGVTYGELGESPEARQIMRGILGEIFLVMDGKGVRVPFSDAEDYYRYLIERQLPPTVSHRSSMLQDISSGRPTEIDALNGAICRYARDLGIEAPYNELLTRLIKFKEGPVR
ncbi:MAG TPA: ketopantoate reductase family protein [Methanotrichaceae archaeon]|nr:ketopantoate reductase family protein [Methanotrichaceae archaeon]